jgi:2-polyprenyl-3-methyl-5-hydroxy-6-metoxy-1,4-benzoquinol methylase
LDIAELARRAKAYEAELAAVKQRLAPEDFSWYPYDTLSGFYVLDQLLGVGHRDLLALAGGETIADIGTADGDTAFFLESLGFSVDAIDFPSTNFNLCRGVHALKDELASSVTIREVDLDARFELPGARYGLAFFLGILYHLKNPFGSLEALASLAKHAVISTRITRFNLARDARGSGALNSERVDLRTVPVAYLVDAFETNGDATNYWMFSEQGLRRILYRAGWDVIEFMTIGNTVASDPATHAGDERAFCLVRSRHC